MTFGDGGVVERVKIETVDYDASLGWEAMFDPERTRVSEVMVAGQEIDAMKHIWLARRGKAPL